MTRQVEPQAKIERMSEEEGTTDRHDMREIERVAIKDDVGGAGSARARSQITVDPQRGRKSNIGNYHQ